MDRALVVLVFVAALGSTTVGGIFYGFSSFVMKALGRLDPEQGVAAMDSINVVVINTNRHWAKSCHEFRYYENLVEVPACAGRYVPATSRTRRTDESTEEGSCAMLGSVHQAGLPETGPSTAQRSRQGSKTDAGRERAAQQRVPTLMERTPWYVEGSS